MSMGNTGPGNALVINRSHYYAIAQLGTNLSWKDNLSSIYLSGLVVNKTKTIEKGEVRVGGGLTHIYTAPGKIFSSKLLYQI